MQYFIYFLILMVIVGAWINAYSTDSSQKPLIAMYTTIIVGLLGFGMYAYINNVKDSSHYRKGYKSGYSQGEKDMKEKLNNPVFIPHSTIQLSIGDTSFTYQLKQN